MRRIRILTAFKLCRLVDPQPEALMQRHSSFRIASHMSGATVKTLHQWGRNGLRPQPLRGRRIVSVTMAHAQANGALAVSRELANVADALSMPASKVKLYKNELRSAIEGVVRTMPGMERAHVTLEGSVAAGTALISSDADYCIHGCQGSFTRGARMDLQAMLVQILPNKGFKITRPPFIGMKAVTLEPYTHACFYSSMPGRKESFDFDLVVDRATYGTPVATQRFRALPLEVQQCAKLLKALRGHTTTSFKKMKGCYLEALTAWQFQQLQKRGPTPNLLTLLLHVLDQFDLSGQDPKQGMARIHRDIQGAMEQGMVPSFGFASVLKTTGSFKSACDCIVRPRKKLRTLCASPGIATSDASGLHRAVLSALYNV